MLTRCCSVLESTAAVRAVTAASKNLQSAMLDLSLNDVESTTVARLLFWGDFAIKAALGVRCLEVQCLSALELSWLVLLIVPART